MASRFIYGQWDIEHLVAASGGGPSNVFIDGGATGDGTLAGGKSPGLVRVSRVAPPPTLMEHWTLLGWTIRLSLVYVVISKPIFGHLGKLWAGLAVNSQQSNQGGLSVNPVPLHSLPGRGQFPADLSTFDVIWTQDDDVATATYDPTAVPLPSTVVPGLVAKTFMFPAPIDAEPGAQLQMQLVLTPGVYGGINQLICVDGSWSLIYDDKGKP